MGFANLLLPCSLLVLALSTGASVDKADPGAWVSERDVPYGSDPEQRLDLFVPSGKGFPTVIFIHGGSLHDGDKGDADYRDVCTPFVEAGIACANVNYRLAPSAPWPAQPRDVAAAVAWIRDSIGGRGGTSQELFLLGHSSGALLAAVVGTDSSFLSSHGLKLSDLCGVIPMGSIMRDDEWEQALEEHGREQSEKAFARDPSQEMYGSLDTYLELWPVHHLRRGQPPFLFLIAEAEQEQPPVLKTNREFVAEARTLGNEAEIQILPGRTHMSAIRRLGEPDDPAFAFILNFIHRRTQGEHE